MSSGSNGWIPLSMRESLSTWHIVGICCAMFGFQIASSAVFSLADPIMNSLKLSDVSSLLAWSCGPIAGFFVQPIVGYYSDKSRFAWGRRRPYILIGCIGTAIGLICLLALKEFGSQLSRNTKAFWLIAILFGTFCSTNIFQGTSRALVGDIVPKNQQDQANTIGSILIGIAAVVPNLIGGFGYFLTSPTYASKVDTITLITSTIFTAICVTITLLCGAEEQNVVEVEGANPFSQIFKAVKNMPKEMISVSLVLFLSWIAYFPFNIKTTSFFEREVFPPSEKEKGLCFGMIVLGASYTFVLIYGFFHVSVINTIGTKTTYALALVFEALCLGSVFFVHSRWGLLATFAPIGICYSIMNSVPFAIVAKTVPESEMGVYMGVLNSNIVIGQQIANIFLVFYGGRLFDKIKKDTWSITKIQTIIGSSAPLALIAAFSCLFIRVPKEDTYHAPLIDAPAAPFV